MTAGELVMPLLHILPHYASSSTLERSNPKVEVYGNILSKDDKGTDTMVSFENLTAISH